MRFTRLLAFATWVVVALLAVASFAAFSPPGATPDATTIAAAPVELAALPPDIGAAAGRQAAFGFSQELLTLEAPTTTTTTTSSSTTTTTSTLPPPTITSSTTTPTRVPVTTTTYPRPTAAPLPPDTVYALVTAYFLPADVERALLVAWCESRYDANAVNPSSNASGLFQHIPRFWDSRLEKTGLAASASIFDPEANTAVAAWLVYSNGGWKHWNPSRGCWGNGTVVPPAPTTTTTLPATTTTEPTTPIPSTTGTTSTTVGNP